MSRRSLAAWGTLALKERAEVFFITGFAVLIMLQLIVALDWILPVDPEMGLEWLRAQSANFYIQILLSLLFYLLGSLPKVGRHLFLFVGLVFAFFLLQFVLLRGVGELLVFSDFELDWSSLQSLSSSVASLSGKWELLMSLGCFILAALNLEQLRSRFSALLNRAGSFKQRSYWYGLTLICFFASDIERYCQKASYHEYLAVIATNPFAALWDHSDFGLIGGKGDLSRSSISEEPSKSFDGSIYQKKICNGCGRNLILIVLESVGSKNLLLPNGEINREYMPMLHERIHSAIVFNAVYPPFPGTTRSHISLQTGGLFPVDTAGVAKSRRFSGPTLARELKNRGFSTALISAQDLSFENLLNFYRGIGFDSIFSPDFMSSKVAQESRTSSWGINDKIAADAALEWWNKRPQERKFVQFVVHSTHHPYLSPNVQLNSLSSLEQYRLAQKFVDKTLDHLISQMTDLDHTLIAIVGDHGEAFGDIHPGNRLHRSALYEENLRSFLVIGATSGDGLTLVSQPLSMGGVAATLLESQGVEADDFPTRSFWKSQEDGPIFFYKMTAPAKCGFRFRSKKAIFSRDSSGRCEVYDLALDDGEQKNLSAVQGELCDRESCKIWLESARRNFMNQIH